MTPALQVKLLRALQDGEIRPVGSTQSATVDARVLAATNRDLEQMMRQGGFREDLYYRLNVIALTLPPLRERREDIPALAEHFLLRFAARQERALRLGADALDRLLAYAWHGNIRELENAMERAAILSRGDTVGADDLPPHIAARLDLGAPPSAPAPDEPGRCGARLHHPDPGAVWLESLAGGRGARHRPDDPLAKMQGVRDRLTVIRPGPGVRPRSGRPAM